MGRPPLKATARTVKTTVRIDEDTIGRIHDLVGPQGMAWFIRMGIGMALESMEADVAAVQAVMFPPKDKDEPKS